MQALFLVEGVGLWLLKRWAEWLTVIITSSLVPIEIYEIHRHPTPVRIRSLGSSISRSSHISFITFATTRRLRTRVD